MRPLTRWPLALWRRPQASKIYRSERKILRQLRFPCWAQAKVEKLELPRFHPESAKQLLGILRRLAGRRLARRVWLWHYLPEVLVKRRTVLEVEKRDGFSVLLNFLMKFAALPYRILMSIMRCASVASANRVGNWHFVSSCIFSNLPTLPRRVEFFFIFLC